jgi:hypothetical protein
MVLTQQQMGPAWLAQMPAMAQVLTTIVLGGIAAYIAYRQWRTAHHRIVLDLFDKRYQVYDALRSAMNPIYVAGAATDDDFFAFTRAADRARLLFGSDVNEFLSQTRQRINRLVLDGKMIKSHYEGHPVQDFHGHVDSEATIMSRLTKFDQELTDAVRPYLWMTHKLPGTDRRT